jgi:hypothetical protein
MSMLLDTGAFPNEELVITIVCLPETLVKSIDQAVDVFHPKILNREHFVMMAAEYAIANLLEEAAAKQRKKEQQTKKKKAITKKRQVKKPTAMTLHDE